jgi:PTS system galactosamine-specific IID component
MAEAVDNRTISGEPLGKLTKSDLNKLGLYSMLEQSGFSFERMQAPGWTLSMLPAFRKIYGNSKEDLKEFMTYNMQFMNTEPHMATFLQGLILSMEEKHEDRKLIDGIRTGLFGPLAGLGDAIFWFTLLPISAAICTSLAENGNVLGPLLYIAIWFISGISRIWFARFGYFVGARALTSLTQQTKYLTKAAGILGVMVVGGLIPAYVSFQFSDTLKFGLGEGTTLQSVFDGILPNMLPLGVVFLIFWSLTKKRINVIYIILTIIGFSVLMSYLGWM